MWPINVAGTLTAIGYSCSPELPGGVNGNLAAEARFQNPAIGDFRLAPGSPGVNAGIAQPWMAGAADLAGEPRLRGRVDMGAYESPSIPGTVLMIR